MQTVAAKYIIIQNRDKRYDGTFYFAVKTTGIVCCPSCPANRPLPKNVEFYDSLETALASGFRPCKRCKPEGLTRNEIHSSLYLLDEMSVHSTAQTIGMSERHL